MRRHSVLAPLFAGLIVLSLVAGPVLTDSGPIGTASAEDTQLCDSNAEWAIWTWTLSLVGGADECDPVKLSNQIKDLQNNTENRTKAEIYHAMLEEKTDMETFRTTFNNSIKMSDSYVWMQVEKAVAEAFANGSSEAEAKNRARSVVSKYYQKKQLNLISDWNATMRSLSAMTAAADNNPDISKSYVKTNHTDFIRPQGGYPVSETLVNGSSHDVARYAIYKSGTIYQTRMPSNDFPIVVHSSPVVSAPNASLDPILIDIRWYGTMWQDIETKHSNLINEVDQFVNNTWTLYQDGELDPEDVISSHTALVKYGTDDDDMASTVAWLAASGFAIPANQSDHMVISYQMDTHSGYVLADSAPDGTWHAGQTYDPSQIDGTVWFANTTGSVMPLEGNFTIEAIKTADGETLQSVNATDQVIQTANTTDLIEQQKRILDLLDRLADRRAQILDGSGGSSTSSTWLSQKDFPMLVLALVVVGVVLILKD